MVGEVQEEDIEQLAQWILDLQRAGPNLGETTPVEPAEFARHFHHNATDAIVQALDEYQYLVRDLHHSRRDPLLLGCLALRGLVMTSDHVASAHQAAHITRPFRTDTSTLVRPNHPWTHQQAAEQCVGSAMFVAPTGSGKTETAQLWACHQDALRPVSHLFYVLPYQASMNAMQLRLQKAHGEVALIHGRALEAVYRQLLDDEYTPASAARKARAARDLARLQVRGTRVLSPYQLLKAAFKIKGYESIAADLFDSALIYDEIHAYEPKRLALIIGQTGDLVASATLPSFLRAWLAEEIPEMAEPIRASDKEFALFRRHRLELTEGDLLERSHIEGIAERARSGSVLVCCNTVGRAQQAFDALRNAGLDPVLLHSRFTARDRLTKEKVLEPGCEQRIVMVATQVVEVSLDVSFGTVYTDPAPLEALFQRFGRVNRFRNVPLVPVHVFTEPVASLVYSSPLVAQAVSTLRKHDEEEIDEAHVTDWLDDQYTPEVLQPMESDYRSTLQRVKGMLRDLAPFQSDPDLKDDFFEMFDSVEVLPECYLDEHQRFIDSGRSIDADDLLVPIRWDQWSRLTRHGLARLGQDFLRIVDVPYDSEYGLRLP